MRDGVPEIEMNDDLNFLAMAHRDKQIYRQILKIVFSNALVELLLIKLGDSAYTCSSQFNSGITEKQNELQLLAP